MQCWNIKHKIAMVIETVTPKMQKYTSVMLQSKRSICETLQMQIVCVSFSFLSIMCLGYATLNLSFWHL